MKTNEEIHKILEEGKLSTTVISSKGKTKFEYRFKGRTWIEEKQLNAIEIYNKIKDDTNR